MNEVVFNDYSEKARLILRSGNQFLALRPTRITANFAISTLATQYLQPSTRLKTPPVPAVHKRLKENVPADYLLAHFGVGNGDRPTGCRIFLHIRKGEGKATGLVQLHTARIASSQRITGIHGRERYPFRIAAAWPKIGYLYLKGLDLCVSDPGQAGDHRRKRERLAGIQALRQRLIARLVFDSTFILRPSGEGDHNENQAEQYNRDGLPVRCRRVHDDFLCIVGDSIVQAFSIDQKPSTLFYSLGWEV